MGNQPTFLTAKTEVYRSCLDLILWFDKMEVVNNSTGGSELECDIPKEMVEGSQ